MQTKIITSPKGEEILNTIRNSTKIDLNILGKIAISRSISDYSDYIPENSWTDKTGRQMNIYSLIGDDELLYKSVLSITEKSHINDDEFFDRIKYHLERGIRLLEQDIVKSNNDPDNFYSLLGSKIISQSSTGEMQSRSLKLFLGEETLSGKQIYLEINNNRIHNNPHLAITGTPGAGKTQVLLHILSQIRKQSNFETNFIFFDYKGEFLDANYQIVDPVKKHFIRETKSEIIQTPIDRIPISPFVLPSYSQESINISVEEKSDSFSSIDRTFGPVQKERLVHIIRKAYELRRDKQEKYPDFDEVFEILKLDYEANNRKEDTLYRIIRQLSELNLFWSHTSRSPLVSKLYAKSLIVDLSKLPALKELVAYLMIEKLYHEMNQLSDVTPVDNIRPIRSILVIDEAHNYLSQKNVFLRKIIRQGRSKGIAVFFASQSPSDYEQDEFDFKELLEFLLIFNTRGLSTRSIQSMYGLSSQVSADLQQRVVNFAPFECLTKVPKDDKGYAIVKSKPYFESIK